MTMDQSVPRDSRRVPLETRVHLKFERFSGFISEYSANISPGGMFITTQTPEPPGTMLEFQLQLGDGFELIRGTGEVVWVRAAADGTTRPAGMGIRFLRLSRGSRDLIYKMVDAHISEGGTPFDLTSGTPTEATDASAAEPPAPIIAEAAPEPAPEVAAPEPALPEAAVPEPAAPAQPAPLPPPPVALELPLEPPARPSRPAVELSPEVAAFLAGGPAPPAAAPAPPVPAGAPAPAAPVFGAAAAASEPRRRGVRPWIWIAAALLLAAGGAALWLGGGLMGSAGTPEAATRPPRSSRTSRPSPSRPARPEPPPPAPAVEATTVPAVPEALEDAAPAAPPTESVPAAAAAPAVRRIQRITWSEGEGETEVILWGDGTFGPASWARSRVDGTPPRELVRLSGLERPYPATRLEVGSGELRQVRTGWHPKPAGAELHVVLDLADPAVVVSRVEERDRRLHIHLRRP